jgi:hypothetical protein
MCPSFPDLMRGLFWLVMAVVLILFAMRAFALMDALEQRLQPPTLHTGRVIDQASTRLHDQARFLTPTPATIQRLTD